MAISPETERTDVMQKIREAKKKKTSLKDELPKRQKRIVVSEESAVKLSKLIAGQMELSQQQTHEFLWMDAPLSRGLNYPENYRIFGRNFSFKDIQVFSDSSVPMDIHYEWLLQGIRIETDDPDFTPLKMTMFDFVYFGVARKLSTLSSASFALPVERCPGCGQATNLEFSYTDLQFDYISDEVKKLPIKVEFESIPPLFFEPMTVEGFLFLYKNDLLYLKKDGNYIYDNNGAMVKDPSALTAIQVSNKSFMDAYSLLSNTTNYNDGLLINKVNDMLWHGLRPMTVKCNMRKGVVKSETELTHKNDPRPICGREYVINLVAEEAAIIPFRGSELFDSNRISFG